MFTKEKSQILKGWAILIMIFIHLYGFKGLPYFHNFDINFSLYINDLPFLHQLTKFGGICIYVYIFISGYGLFISFSRNNKKWLHNCWKKLISLYVNYWIVLILFIILNSTINHANFSLTDFLLNFICINASYNREWWFLFPYAILLIFSKPIFLSFKKFKEKTIFLSAFIIYCIAQMVIHQYREILMNKFYFIFLLLNTCNLLFCFVVGALFAKKNIFDLIALHTTSFTQKSLAVSLLILVIIISLFIPSLGLQPFYMILFVSVLSCIKYNRLTYNILYKLGAESTNMWFIHTFFIYHFFTDIVYISKYPLIVYLVAILLSYISALLITQINKPIQTIIKKQFN